MVEFIEKTNAPPKCGHFWCIFQGVNQFSFIVDPESSKVNITIFVVSLNFYDSIMLIKLIWKTMIGSLEWKFQLPILFLLYIVLLLPVTVDKLFKKLHIVDNYIDVYLLFIVKFVCN